MICETSTQIILIGLHHAFSRPVTIYALCGVNVPAKHVLMLLRSMYGLKQASLQWNKHLNKTLTALGFKRSPYDPCVYHLHKPNDEYLRPVYCMQCPPLPPPLQVQHSKARKATRTPAEDEALKTFVVTYGNSWVSIRLQPDPKSGAAAVVVDDIITASNSIQLINKFEKQMAQRYDIKSLGKPTRLVGINIVRKNDSMTLDQRQFIKDAAAQFKQLNSKPVSTPAALGDVPEGASPLLSPGHKYLSLAGWFTPLGLLD